MRRFVVVLGLCTSGGELAAEAAPFDLKTVDVATLDASKQAAVANANADAAASEKDAATAPARPQLLAVRGGSLGFPSASNNEGVQAGVDAKITADASLSSTSSADAFAKVGGLDMGKVRAEVIGESFDADIPVITLTGMPAIPVMTKTGFAAVGIRARVNIHQAVWASHSLKQDCIKFVALKRLETNDDDQLQDAAADAGCKDELAAVTAEAVWSVMGGMRVVKRGTGKDALTDLGGVEWELGLRRDSEKQVEGSLSWSVMAGLAGLHLNEADVVTDGITTRFVRMNDIRAMFAVEIRRPATKDVSTASLGVYGVYSRDYWTNHFHPGGDDQVRDYQLEGGMYVSGVMKGFSGMIMISMIKPYAHGAENVYAVSVIPFGGAVPKEDKQ